MFQETGETRNAIIEDDNRQLKEIVAANSSLKEKYWIVVFAKPSRNTIEGKPVLAKHIKAYKTKPQSQVGMIVGEVDNHLGTIKWEVNMPQVPFNYDGLIALGAQEGQDVVTETTTIPWAYVTK